MNNFVRIISKKIPTEKYCNIIPMYVNSLSESVKNQNGFISSHSFWNVENDMIYSMSDWKTLKDWEDWHGSGSRNEIFENYKNSIKSESCEIFYKRKHKNDFFLL